MRARKIVMAPEHVVPSLIRLAAGMNQQADVMASRPAESYTPVQVAAVITAYVGATADLQTILCALDPVFENLLREKIEQLGPLIHRPEETCGEPTADE